MHSLCNVVMLWQPFGNNQKLSRMMSKLTLSKIMFLILMFQQNSIKTRQNLHVNVTIAYKKNSVPSNV